MQWVGVRHEPPMWMSFENGLFVPYWFVLKLSAKTIYLNQHRLYSVFFDDSK